MEYFFSEQFIGGTRLAISEADFSLLKRAIKSITLLHELDEAFDIFVRSYVEFEEYLSKTSIQLICNGPDNYGRRFFDEVRSNSNLRLVGILNSSRFFEELVYRTFSTLKRDFGISALNAKKEFSNAYDKSLEYRLMYSLRNFSAHHSVPIRLYSIDTRRQPESLGTDPGPIRVRYTINPRYSSNRYPRAAPVGIDVRDGLFLGL